MEATKHGRALKRYDAYKDSGVEWLGEIPEHWEVKRIKYLFKEINERSATGEEDLLSVSQYTGVTKKRDNVDEGELLTNAQSLDGYKMVKAGDLVSNIMLAWNGSLGFSIFDGITSPAYSVYRLNTNFEKNYFHYLFRTDLYKSEFKRNSSGVIESRLRLYTEDFFQITSILPPLLEQTAIARFLDDKTAKIEQAIAIKERQIELLKERQQVLIQRAVTKGLDPDAKMKDSGVEWIGEIPEEWEVKRLAVIGNFSKGGGFSKSDLTETGIPAILYGDIYTKYDFILRKVNTTVSAKSASKSVEAKENDLLFTGSGETRLDIGKCIAFKSKKRTVVGGDVIIFRQKIYDSLYLSYALNTDGAKNEKAKYSKGEIIVHTYASKLKELYIPIPPLKEQFEISNSISDSLVKFDSFVSIKKSEIEKLKEYKASLIDSVVTGKIRVC